jgi:hypothetical protein
MIINPAGLKACGYEEKTGRARPKSEYAAMTVIRPLALVVLMVLVSAGWRQAAVTAADIARFETTMSEITTRLATIRTADPALAAEVDKSLADLRDDVTYLKVKLRREGSVTRADYTDVRDRLETLRLRAGGQKVSAQPVPAGDPMAPTLTVPVGAEIDGRLQTPLSSATAKVDQRFELLMLADVKVGSTAAVPAGTVVRGFVSSVRAAGKLDRRGSLTLSFDEILIGTTHVRLRASVTQAFEASRDDEMTRLTAGTVGGGVGGVMGSRGALRGVLIGAGGTLASTEAADVELPIGTVLRIRVDQPFDVIRLP